VLHDYTLDSIDSMSVNMVASADRDCKKCKVTFNDTMTDDDVGMQRGSAAHVHLSTDCNRGNSVIFSAEMYDHCEGFSDRCVLLDTCAGESLFKSKNVFYFTEP
jgi:hypothetical protein